MFKNPIRMWMLVPFGIFSTMYIFYYEIIKNQPPPIFQFSPSVNSAIQAWAMQDGIHIAGQALTVQAILLGFLILYIEWINRD